MMILDMKVAIKTYGCQMNERDSDMIAELMSRHGYSSVKKEADADVVIVNTCSVREKAEQKALGKLGLLVAEAREHPGRIVGVAGCMAQRMGDDVLRRVPGLDFVVGTRRLWMIPAIVDEVLKGRGPIVDVSEESDRSASVLSAGKASGISAFINILFGCNRRCSYCIVPDVRGPEWSRPAFDVIQEARLLVEKGVKEITLLGQSVMSYGRCNCVWNDGCVSKLGFEEPLPRLLEALSEVDGLKRVRFTSGHPLGCTVELARAFAELPSVCPHLHLPAQSGSDRILKLMNRGYSTSEFKTAVERLRDAAPELALTTDIIVGFPSESVADFEATRVFMDEMMFANSFIFKYNPRPGTPAAAWADDVSDEEKLRRNHVLLDDQDRRGLELNERFVGRSVEVLAAGVSKRNAARWSGRTACNRIVVFDAEQGPVSGTFARVFIDRAGAQTLYGKLESGDCSLCPN